MTARAPSLRLERTLQRQGHRLLAGMDEVGRGALAGPVTVGVVVIDETCRSAPPGVRDSKLLTPAARARLVPALQRWAHQHAVGHAEPQEIDRIGIIAALRLAAHRALAALTIVPDLVLLDGNHDWLTPPEQVGLLAFAADASSAAPAGPPVLTLVKADQRCSSVAAASVLAKVARDELMITISGAHPAYGWAANKGYAAADHVAALAAYGPCEMHRRSWRLPGVVERTGPVGPRGPAGEAPHPGGHRPLGAPSDDPTDPRHHLGAGAAGTPPQPHRVSELESARR